jgi:hypothetical protein
MKKLEKMPARQQFINQLTKFYKMKQPPDPIELGNHTSIIEDEI